MFFKYFRKYILGEFIMSKFKFFISMLDVKINRFEKQLTKFKKAKSVLEKYMS